MSFSIWMQCAGDSELRPLRLAPWRAVEAQHLISTRKLVASDAEQMLLEEMIDRVKPPVRAPAHQHYLLTTPFRYPPLRSGSRFGTRHERGIWYGSETRRTAASEVAYYRLVFLEGTAAKLGTVTTQLTMFRVGARTERGVDLTEAPFIQHDAAIRSPVSYSDTQLLGAEMRAAGVEMFRSPSARDPDGGANIGIFTPEVFGRAKPREMETWHCTASTEVVEFARRDYFTHEVFVFARGAFLVDGKLPAPSV